jgi:hypothetical protein
LTLRDLNKSCHKRLVKILSLSVMINNGNPWSLKMLSRNSCTTVLVVNGWLIAMKCAYLVRLSTTTKIVSLPLDSGKASMKSIVKCWKAMSGMGRGGSNSGMAHFHIC